MSAAPLPVFGVAPLGTGLLEDPVAFLSAEHARQMALLAHLDRLARAPSARGARTMAAALLRWLTEELPVHVADEERSLYPRLLPHAPTGAVDRLRAQHRRARSLVRATVDGLRRLVAGVDAGPGFAAAASALARQQRASLSDEEASVTPLARAVLTREAVQALAGEMAARRGLRDRTTCQTER